MPQTTNHSEAHAREQDRLDPLRSHRDLFAIPTVGSVARDANRPDAADSCVYLCGNSLGLMPMATRQAVLDDLDAWARLGVEGHFHAQHPWFPAHEFVRDTAARLVGAKPREVVVMNSLTANLHLMMVSFYRPHGDRKKIVIEDSAFPSDSYAVQSQAAWHGLAPEDAVIRLKPRPGEHTLRTDDVCGLIAEQGQSIALILIGGVNYLTGQLMDMHAITEAGHKAGAIVGWDLAHAAGNVPLHLHEWNADFACWCSYKYLNAGPGAVGGCFIHERHTANTTPLGQPGFLPRLAGWWGNNPETRFKMGPDFQPTPTADAWSLSNPPILALTPVRVSLDIFDRAGMSALREKGLRLNAYLRDLLHAIPGATSSIHILTPNEPSAHGCQLSIAVLFRARELHTALTAAGVACDFREPNVIRVAAVPLYNTFHDCWRFADILRRHLGGGHR